MLIRKRFRVVSLAAVIIAAAVPFGFALSLPSDPMGARADMRVVSATSASQPLLPLVAAPAHDGSIIGSFGVDDVPDEARLLVMGAALFGLAAAFRKSTP
jgi:hypothetical protein